jgi:hypothetical protein
VHGSFLLQYNKIRNSDFKEGIALKLRKANLFALDRFTVAVLVIIGIISEEV